jgi:hypothetical protein
MRRSRPFEGSKIGPSTTNSLSRNPQIVRETIPQTPTVGDIVRQYERSSNTHYARPERFRAVAGVHMGLQPNLLFAAEAGK